VATTDGLKLLIPELTDTADGPDAISDLANGVEDYVYDRQLPTGVTRYPVHHWGSGTSFPTVGQGVKVGDTYTHTGIGAMFRFTGVGTIQWAQVSVPEVSGLAPLNAISSNYGSLLPSGFLVRRTDWQFEMAWDPLAGTSGKWVFKKHYGEKNPTGITNTGPSAHWAVQPCAVPFGSGLQRFHGFTFRRGNNGLVSWDNTNKQFTVNVEGIYAITLFSFIDLPGYRSQFQRLVTSTAAITSAGDVEDHRLYAPGTSFPGCNTARHPLSVTTYLKEASTVYGDMDCYGTGVVANGTNVNWDVYFGFQLIGS